MASINPTVNPELKAEIILAFLGWLEKQEMHICKLEWPLFGGWEQELCYIDSSDEELVKQYLSTED